LPGSRDRLPANWSPPPLPPDFFYIKAPLPLSNLQRVVKLLIFCRSD
jgi:hypothetical protein